MTIKEADQRATSKQLAQLFAVMMFISAILVCLIFLAAWGIEKL